MLEDAHANIARMLSRIDHELSLALEDIAIMKIVGVDSPALQARIEKIIADVTANERYVDETLSDDGPFSEQKRTISRKARTVVRQLGEIIIPKGRSGTKLERMIRALGEKRDDNSLTEEFQEYSQLLQEVRTAEGPLYMPYNPAPSTLAQVGALVLCCELSLLALRRFRRN